MTKKICTRAVKGSRYYFQAFKIHRTYLNFHQINRIAVAFGGSGYKSSSVTMPQVAALALLSAPVKIIERAVDLTAPKHSYGGVILNTAAMREAELQHHHNATGSSAASATPATISNSTLDVAAIPTTQVRYLLQNILYCLHSRCSFGGLTCFVRLSFRTPYVMT